MTTKSFTSAIFLLILFLVSTALYAEPVWIDVRSAAEHKIDHIDGDIRITHTDIVEELSKQFPDKNTEIKLYCRSGNRAGKALLNLREAGYNNVENVGSIGDARDTRNIEK